MKTRIEPENRSWPRENTTPAAATKNDRIMAGQNDTEGHRSVLMILSCHDSDCIPDLQESTRRDFEKEPTERTEIRKAKSFCPASIETCRDGSSWSALGSGMNITVLALKSRHVYG
jgi:hypothetical protein